MFTQLRPKRWLRARLSPCCQPKSRSVALVFCLMAGPRQRERAVDSHRARKHDICMHNETATSMRSRRRMKEGQTEHVNRKHEGEKLRARVLRIADCVCARAVAACRTVKCARSDQQMEKREMRAEKERSPICTRRAQTARTGMPVDRTTCRVISGASERGTSR